MRTTSKELGPDQFGIDITADGFKVLLPDRLITRDDLRLLLEGIRDLVTEYNNVTLEALRAASANAKLPAKPTDDPALEQIDISEKAHETTESV